MTAPAPTDVAAMRAQWQQIKALAPAVGMPEMATALQDMELLLDYEDQREAIANASKALEPYRDQFVAMMDDEPAAMDCLRALFSQETFTSMRFHEGDIQRAFEKVGYPGLVTDPATIDVMRKGMLYLANKNWRQTASTRLMLMLPEYVTAGRYLDGWMIQHSAFSLMEHPHESCPFLFEMFQLGLEAWEDKRRSADEAIFEKLGVDISQLKGLSPEEALDKIGVNFTDPQYKQEMEAYINSQPSLRAALEAECASADRLSIQLLDRDDAGELLPSIEETTPWIQQFFLRAQADEELAKVMSGAKPNKKTADKLGQSLMDVATAMAEAVYTPERVTRLNEQLRQFARQHQEAHDRDGFNEAMAALIVMGRDTRTSHNQFLANICYTAMRDYLLHTTTPPDESPTE